MRRKDTLTPEFLWAQRKDQIYLTLNVPNVKKDAAKVGMKDEGKVTFSGKGGILGKESEYVLDITLLKGIKAAESVCKISPRSVMFRIKKADTGPHWERLLKAEGRNVHCKIDWQHWVDEDEEEDEFSPSFAESKDHEVMDFTADGSSEEDDSSPTSAAKAAEVTL